MRRVLVALVRGYQVAFSPLLGLGKCRFQPTCSHYAVTALERHGSVRGLALVAWRLLRCQPLCRGGYDPVPPRAASPADDAAQDPAADSDPS